ncbi:MAG: hypothetical protein OJF55_002802 [Rhodanobacteraceae bacterium]|jgi:hypothetical protein|nr:MAG: hypothetical protein OJF55_002802 [Rhodanobacteraceae bacterium]
MHHDDRKSRWASRSSYVLSAAQQEEIDRIAVEMRGLLGEAEDEGADDNATKALDRAAIDDERVFIRRFWFDWPRRDRVAVIALKHQCDLTDREIRLLRWTGNLRRRNGVVTLASARWAAVFGRCLAILMFFEFGVAVLSQMASIHQRLSPAQFGKLYGVTAFVLAMLWLVHLGYIKPWVIEQRVMREAGATVA